MKFLSANNPVIFHPSFTLEDLERKEFKNKNLIFKRGLKQQKENLHSAIIKFADCISYPRKMQCPLIKYK